MGLSGKVALVTGGAQGLGQAITKTLLQHDVQVAMVDVQAQTGEETLKEFQKEFGDRKVTFFKADITSQDEFEEAFRDTKAKFGGLDLVINNAGVSGESPDKWERTIDINLKGTMRGTLLALEHLRKDRGGNGGVIVNVASMAGLKPNPCGPAYGASKSAIIHYSLCWAMNPEVIANGVRINVLAPAFVETPLVAQLKRPENSFLPDIADKIIHQAGMLTPEYVAMSLLELLDDEENKHRQVLTIGGNTGKSYVSM